MRSLVFLVAGIALLVIMGVSILHAQSISSSAGVNGNVSVNVNVNVSATGLVTSYYVHLIIAERWVEALNASGINSTAVVELINEAKSYANTGNYLEAIVTLNNAVNLAAQLMASTRINSTQTVINNYVSLTSAVNSTVINNLLSNETIANFTLRALSALSGSSNASYLVKMGVAILSSEEGGIYIRMYRLMPSWA